MWYQWASAVAFATWHSAYCLTLGIPKPGNRQSDNALVLATCWTTRYTLCYSFGAVAVAWVEQSVGTAQGLTPCPTQTFGDTDLTLINLPVPRSIPPTWLGQPTTGATG